MASGGSRGALVWATIVECNGTPVGGLAGVIDDGREKTIISRPSERVRTSHLDGARHFPALRLLTSSQIVAAAAGAIVFFSSSSFSPSASALLGQSVVVAAAATGVVGFAFR